MGKGEREMMGMERQGVDMEGGKGDNEEEREWELYNGEGKWCNNKS